MSGVIALLEEQHDEIERLLDQVPRVMGSVREQAFFELRRLLAVHEAVEQRFVHPVAEHTGTGSPDGRVHEEHDTALLIATLEALDVESTEFETKFAGLRDAVLQHAEAEELTEFPDLHGRLEAESDDRAQTERAREAFARLCGELDAMAVAAMSVPFAQLQDQARAALA